MAFEVLLAADAEHDIEDVYRYIAEHDGILKADRVLAALEDACKALEHLPERGNVPKELRDLGMTKYREAHYKPCRVIWRILDGQVIVYCVVDGRRDMQSLLLRRLMR